MKTETQKNEHGNFLFADFVRQCYVTYVAVVNNKRIGSYNTILGAKRAINKSQGIKSKQWIITFD